MNKKQIFVSPDKKNNNWRIHKPGAVKDIKHTKTKNEAIEIAKRISKNQQKELIIQNKNGIIKEKNTYPKSRDKYLPKG